MDRKIIESIPGIKLLEFSKNKCDGKVGILRSRIDVKGENFIYEELKNFQNFDCVYFCGEIHEKNSQINKCYRGDYSLMHLHNRPLRVLSKKSAEYFFEVSLQEDLKCFIIQFANEVFTFYYLITLSKIPLIINIRGSDLHFPYIIPLLKKLERFIFKIIVRCNFQKEKLLEFGIEDSKIEVIYGGIDIEGIPFEFRKLSKSNLKILSAGRFVEKKGFDITLKAFKNILKEH